MSTIEIVKPAFAEGIEFYVSADGRKSGVSQVGLARLCGVTETSIRDLLLSLTISADRVKKPPKPLEDLLGEALSIELSSSRQAKVVDRDIAARVISYYAFEGRHNTKEAKLSLKKFATKGIDTWIKEITGYASEGKLDLVIEQLQFLTETVVDMKQTVDKWKNLEGNCVRLYPGLGGIKDALSTTEGLNLLEDKTLYTAKDWLEQTGMPLNGKQIRRFVLMASETYKTLRHQDPPYKMKKHQTSTGKSVQRREARGYRSSDFSILEEVYKKVTIG